MNSTNFNVSGKNATTSIFITISENQKEEAERLEYEIKNSHTSTEEEAEKYVDDEDCEEEEEEESDYENEHDEMKHLKEVEILKNEIERMNKVARKLMENQTKLTERFNRKNKEVKELKKELREERIFRRDYEDNFFRLLDEHRRLEKVMKNVDI
jgi:hypothetical protein